MVGRLLSYWEGHFLGAMLNFQGVYCRIFSILTMFFTRFEGFEGQIVNIDIFHGDRQPTPSPTYIYIYTPLRNKGLSGGLIKGNQWLLSQAK